MENQIVSQIDQIGKYTWLDTLGGGNIFDLVGKAQNNLTGELVVIKVWCRENLKKRKVERVILLHKGLTGHPLIAEFKEVFSTGDLLCIVMEYVQGGDMKKYIVDCCTSGAPLTEDEARGWFQQVVLARRFCYKIDVNLESILRAFEPSGVRDGWFGQKDKCKRDENIWFAKLCDCGYKRSSVLAEDKYLGAFTYLSPEILYTAGVDTYDPEKADMWALGVVLYCLLVASFPFGFGKYRTIEEIRAISTAAYKFPETCKVSCEAKQLVGCLLVPDPEERFSICEILENPWFKKNLPSNWKQDFSYIISQKQNLLQSDEEILSIIRQVSPKQTQNVLNDMQQDDDDFDFE